MLVNTLIFYALLLVFFWSCRGLSPQESTLQLWSLLGSVYWVYECDPKKQKTVFLLFDFILGSKIGNQKSSQVPNLIISPNCVFQKLFIKALLTHHLGLGHELLCLQQFMSCSFVDRHTDLLGPFPSPLLLLSGSLILPSCSMLQLQCLWDCWEVWTGQQGQPTRNLLYQLCFWQVVLIKSTMRTANVQHINTIQPLNIQLSNNDNDNNNRLFCIATLGKCQGCHPFIRGSQIIEENLNPPIFNFFFCKLAKKPTTTQLRDLLTRPCFVLNQTVHHNQTNSVLSTHWSYL